MPTNKFENFIIRKVIIHQIYKREVVEFITPPFYNSECSDLDYEASDILKQRITKAMSHKSHAIQMDFVDDSNESVFRCCSDFWMSDMSDNEFIEMSKKITRKLAEAQITRAIPGGIVVVVKGTIQKINKPCIAVIKAERQNGFTAEEIEGKMILKFFNDLLLTPHQKLQKIGFFINNAVAGNTINKTDVDAFVFDSNTDSSTSASKANYFYSGFLGLDFKKDSDLLTSKFFVETKNFIGSYEKFDSNKKIDLITALLTYLKFNVSQFINVNTFAEEYFGDTQAIDAYINYVEKREVPLTNISKNLSMIGDKLKQRQFNFANNIRLQAPVDDFDDVVQINENEDGCTHIIVRGRMLNEK